MSTLLGNWAQSSNHLNVYEAEIRWPVSRSVRVTVLHEVAVHGTGFAASGCLVTAYRNVRSDVRAFRSADPRQTVCFSVWFRTDQTVNSCLHITVHRKIYQLCKIICTSDGAGPILGRKASGMWKCTYTAPCLLFGLTETFIVSLVAYSRDAFSSERIISLFLWAR
jgi:hypothetical protein